MDGSAAGAGPKIDILRLEEHEMEFVLTGVDSSVANSLRRVMMAEVPTVAIDLVNIYENSSVLHDEFIAHRLGLVPVKWTGDGELRDAYPFPWECDCDIGDDGVCPKCSIRLTLSVTNSDTDPEAEPITVTSNDLKIDTSVFERDSDKFQYMSAFEVCHFSHELDRQRAPYDVGIVIVKLGPGQSLVVDCVARVGIGKIHAKYNPTSTVAMRHDPDIRLHRDLLEGVAPRDKQAFVKACQPGVFTYDRAADQIVLERPHLANNIDEIKKAGSVIQRKYGLPDNVVTVGFVPERFIYTVETCGSLAPERTLDTALGVLSSKMKMVSENCAVLAAGGAAAMGAVALVK